MEEKKEKRKPVPPKQYQFGQPNGNPIGNQRQAVAMRDFYRWLARAKESEILEFVADKEKPMIQRLYAQKLLKKGTIKDLHDFTEQIAGKPKETIEFQNVPSVNISCIGGLPK